MEPEALLPQLLRLPLADASRLAEVNGYSIRVVRQDGREIEVATDFRMTRINVHLRNGIVTRADVG